jgi:hypothetical protein
VDDTGASVGKRYARSDELGIPFGITVDFDTLGQGPPGLADTVTLRERDSMEQLRVPVGAVVEAIARVCLGSQDWAGLCALYPTQDQSKEGEGATAVGGGGAATAVGGGAGAAVGSVAGAAVGGADGMAFLRAHGVEALLNRAVNDAIEQRPADPVKFIAEALLALPRS